MRNLKLQYCQQFPSTVSEAKFILINPNDANSNDDYIYIVTTTKLYALRGKDGNVVEEIADVPGIVGADFLALENQICLASEAGEVIVIDPTTRAISEGTFCDVGIECMAWSPDQEVVVFVTKTQNVVVMTCTYDPIAEHVLSEQCSGDDQFINVGWGKKETQFHGSEGKTAAKQKSNFHAPNNIKDLPKKVEISWRADGAYFAVSFVSDEWGRMFKVFDKEGKLNFTSEKLNDLQPAFSWRPTGTWIAIPQRLPNKSIIALFEKNGLRHREIILPFHLDKEEVLSLKWSADSTILSVETMCESKEKCNLYLYTIGNYHWYLKQVLSFNGSNPIATYNWDNRIGEDKTLHIALNNGKYLIYRWHFAIEKFEQVGMVFVIDGNKLLLSNFSKTIIPPPMCNTELLIDAPINASTIFANEDSELQLCLYDANHDLHLFKTNSENPLRYEKICLLHADDTSSKERIPLDMGNFFWFNEHFLIATHSMGCKSKLQLISLDTEERTYKIESSLQINGVVRAITKGSSELENILVQTQEGKVLDISLKIDNSLKSERIYVELNQVVDQLQWYASSTFTQSALISLRTNRHLYIDSKSIANNVTSFHLTRNYLVFTTICELYFVRLNDPEYKVLKERKIERGGKLITIIANDARTILQMPRGNLEAICPRILVLEIIGTLLDRKEYNKAFDLLRKQRINLNIICDHSMCSFVDNLHVFLNDIKNPQWLNLFIADLENADVSKTMYASNYVSGNQTYPEGLKIEEKINFICEKLCEYMEKNNEDRFRLPIITAYVKIGKIEKALQIIWEEKNRNNDKNADDAMKYLLYLVDVNDLYNVALGTYDFQLVMFVAAKSQKDPKEYLPYLNTLNSYEPNYRKFKIDEHLKRNEKALSHISHCGSERFDEALKFIKQHSLYRQAMQYYEQMEHSKESDGNSQQQDFAECYRQVCLAFGDYLRTLGKLENASLMYERGENYAQALISAKHVLDWQRALALAKKDKQDIKNIAISMVSPLQEQGRFEEAAELLKMYSDFSFNDILQCLISGKLFLKAIYETRLHHQESEGDVDYIANSVRPQLLSYRTMLDDVLIADQKLFVSYKQRLEEIREKRKQKQANPGEDSDEPNDADECDLLSDTTSMNSSRYSSSVGSRSTGKTFRSSKNRRKHERKLLSLKPGNPFEDIALIDALHNHVFKISNQQKHIRDICKALIEVQQDELAASLQLRFKQLLKLVEDSLDEIWIPEMMFSRQLDQFVTAPTIDYTQLQNEQRYSLLKPLKRFKPQLNLIAWEHEILR